MVVVEERQWSLVVAKLEDPAIHRLAAELPASFAVSHKLSQALATYVERRRYLSPPRRTESAAHLSDLLMARFNLPGPIDHDGLLCALYLRTFVLVQSPREAKAEA